MSTELRSLVVIFVVAAIAPLVVDLPRRVRVPVVVAEITLGILIGPQVLGFAEPEGVVELLSRPGLCFLFFLAGLEVDIERIRGRPARLGAYGWALSAVIALGIAMTLQAIGFVLSPCSSGWRCARRRSAP